MNQNTLTHEQMEPKKSLARNWSVILWLTVPFAILFLQWKFEFFGIVGMSFLYILLGISLGLEILVFKYYLNSEKKKDLPWILISVFLIQSLAILVLEFTDDETAWRFFVFFLFLFFFLLPEIIVAVLGTIFYFIFKKKNRTEVFIKKLSWVAVAIGILGIFIFPAWNHSYKKNRVQQKHVSGVTDYDLSGVAFREPTKKNTTLGQYKRPLRILREGDTFFGVAVDGERIPLSFLDSLKPDVQREMYFDVFTDRVYFVKDKKIFVFDIAKNTTTLLPEPIQKAIQEKNCLDTPCIEKEMVGAHKDTLQIGYEVYNIQTGELVSQTVSVGYDESRVYLVWVDGKGYRFIIDSKDKGNVREHTLRMYLEDHDEPFYVPSQDEIFDRWGKIVYSGGRSIYFTDRTPIFTLETNYPKAARDDISQFSVRNLYLLENKKLGLEVEDKLVVVDLKTKKVDTTVHPQEIENLLASASLLWSDFDQFNRGLCADNSEIDNLIKDNARDFVFCLL